MRKVYIKEDNHVKVKPHWWNRLSRRASKKPTTRIRYMLVKLDIDINLFVTPSETGFHISAWTAEPDDCLNELWSHNQYMEMDGFKDYADVLDYLMTMEDVKEHIKYIEVHNTWYSIIMEGQTATLYRYIWDPLPRMEVTRYPTARMALNAVENII